MQLNKVVKSFVIAIPLLALAACSSDSNSDDTNMNGANGNGSDNGFLGGNGQFGSGSAQEQLQALQRANLVYFGFDKYDISPEFEELLNAHAAFLRGNPDYKVVVEGHADERGTPEYNIALGERRANAVQMYLQGKGVSGSQISIVSYGKEKPAVLGHDEAAWAKNRRAVLVY